MSRNAQFRDRAWKVLGIVAMGAAIALALWNGWYNG